MEQGKITTRVIGARTTVAAFMEGGGGISANEVRLALETLTAAGVFTEIDAAVTAASAPTHAPSRRRLGAGPADTSRS